MIIQHPVISGTDTSTCQPSFISVFFQPGEYTERQFFPSDIELCPIEVSTPEKAVKLLAETLEEEKETDLKLTDLAVGNINQKAQK